MPPQPFEAAYLEWSSWGIDDAYLAEIASNCNMFDDDEYYPSHHCNVADYHAEYEYHMLETPLYADLCKDTYNATTKSSWSLICAYEALLNLDDVCANNFSASMPTASSADRPPHLPEYPKEKTPNNPHGHCNTHAFCYMCVDERGGIDEACHAVITHYNTTLITDYNRGNFMQDIDYWCDWNSVRKMPLAAASVTTNGAPFSFFVPAGVVAVTASMVFLAAVSKARMRYRREAPRRSPLVDFDESTNRRLEAVPLISI